MNKIKYFLNKFEELKKKIKIKSDIHLQKDNRLRSKVASINIYKYIDGKKEICYILRYNTNQLKGATETQVLTVILHELGHIKLGHIKFNKRTYKSLEELEYEAENFALDMIKKYYSKHYKIAIDNLKMYSEYLNGIYRNVSRKLYQERKYV